jgi:3-phenylpropionate/trans-cinnamate dioxygenase ferredoxin reductase subunit
MKNYTYIIVGGGMTGYAAVKGIREVDPQGSIGLFSLEKNKPYKRPPLTKGLWKGKPLESIWLKDMPEEKLDLHLGLGITSIDPSIRLAKDEKGQSYGYEKLLLATGGVIRTLPFENEAIHYYRIVDDYQKLRALTGKGKQFAVLGGGFIGAEIGAALSMVGEQVAILFPDAGIGSRIFPHDLMEFIDNYYTKKGVKVLNNVKVTKIGREGDKAVLELDKGFPIQADVVVAGIGITPDTSLAKEAGATISDGIEVDDSLRTNLPHVYAAGDAASFYNPALGFRLRVEHEDNALSMGKAAGRNMALSLKSLPPEPYHYLPYFYSDLFELGYEAVGRLDARLETVSDWQEPFRKGVVYYLGDGRIRGVLLWNVWGKVEDARQLIARPGPITAADLLKEKPIQ